MRPPRLLRCGPWLGLLAMWLVLTMPLLSQVRAATHGQAHPQHAQAPMHHGQGMPGAAQHGRGEAPWAACDYCTLLIGSPALQPASLLAGGTPAAGPQPACVVRVGFPRATTWPGARSRAPPPSPA